MVFNHREKTRSIQRMQTPPRLWSLNLSCDFDLKSRSKRLMSLDFAYCIVSWYQVWCKCFTRYIYHHLLILCDLWPHLWPSAFVMVTCTFVIYLMMLNVCTKNEVCRFNRIWNMHNCMEKLKWRHHDVIPHLIFMKFLYKSAKGISKRHTKFQIDQTYESWDIQ